MGIIGQLRILAKLRLTKPTIPTIDNNSEGAKTTIVPNTMAMDKRGVYVYVPLSEETTKKDRKINVITLLPEPLKEDLVEKIAENSRQQKPNKKWTKRIIPLLLIPLLIPVIGIKSCLGRDNQPEQNEDTEMVDVMETIGEGNTTESGTDYNKIKEVTYQRVPGNVDIYALGNSYTLLASALGMAGQEAMTEEYVFGTSGSYDFDIQADYERETVNLYKAYKKIDFTISQCINKLNDPNSSQEEILNALKTLSDTMDAQNQLNKEILPELEKQVDRFCHNALLHPDDRTIGEINIAFEILEELEHLIQLGELNPSSFEELIRGVEEGNISITGVESTPRRRLRNIVFRISGISYETIWKKYVRNCILYFRQNFG